MDAIQKRCLWCTNYRVVEDDCRLDSCEYDMAVRTRRKVRNRRSGKDAFRDMLGNHIDDCGDKKLLKTRKLENFIEHDYGETSWA